MEPDGPSCRARRPRALMLWFYDRDQRSLTIETRYEVQTAEFVACIRWPDGREQVERFTDLTAFRDWLAILDRTLEAQRWRPRTAVVLPYGWPIERLS
jgi:hypothetical protein